jgi:hypothetical protein
MHKADITTMLGKMCSAHLLESSGHGRGTRNHVYGTIIGLSDTKMYNIPHHPRQKYRAKQEEASA